MFAITKSTKNINIVKIFNSSREMVNYCIKDLKLTSNKTRKLIQNGRIGKISLTFI